MERNVTQRERCFFSSFFLLFSFLFLYSIPIVDKASDTSSILFHFSSLCIWFYSFVRASYNMYINDALSKDVLSFIIHHSKD